VALPSNDEWDNPAPQSVGIDAPLTANPHLLAQGQRGVANAQARDVNSLADPKTYSFVSGLLGTPPDQQGFSVFKPNLQDIKAAGDVGYGLGLGAQALPFLGAAAKAAPAVGRELAGTAVDKMLSGESMIPGMPASMVNPPVTSVVKQGGGNWLTNGSEGIDRNVEKLKVPVPFGNDPVTMEQNLRTIGGAGDAEVQQAHNGLKVNDWIESKLKPYIKNQMGTVNDPVRIQADEKNILHMPAGNPPLNSVGFKRLAGDFPAQGMSKTFLGNTWEVKSDNALDSVLASDLLADNPKLAKQYPWLLKIDPESNVNIIDDRHFDDLGFNHIIDVLHEKLNSGEISHKDLSKMSVPDAVKRTHEYDQELKSIQAKAQREDLKNLNISHKTDNGVVVKLEKPGQFAKESDAMSHSVRGYEPPEDHPDWVKESGNKGRYSYGHGGWDAIKSGKAEVHSVRDFDNTPQATIEISNLPEINYKSERLPDDLRAQLRAESEKEALDFGYKPNTPQYNNAVTGGVILKEEKWFRDNPETVSKVTQIKGRVNGQVDPKHTETVKSFLNSRKFGSVNDLDKVNLVDLENERSVYHSLYDVLGDYKLPHEREEAFRNATAANPDVPRFMNRQEFMDFVKPPEQEPIKKAKGGHIKKKQPTIDEMRYALMKGK